MINWLMSGQWCFIESIFCTLERVTPCIESYPSINGPSLPRFVPFELRWLYQCSHCWQMLFSFAVPSEIFGNLYANTVTTSAIWYPYHWLFCRKLVAVAKSGYTSLCRLRQVRVNSYLSFCHCRYRGISKSKRKRNRRPCWGMLYTESCWLALCV